MQRAIRESDGLPVLLKALRTDFGHIADLARFKHAYERIRLIDSAGQYVWAFYNSTNIPTNSFLQGAPLREVMIACMRALKS